MRTFLAAVCAAMLFSIFGVACDYWEVPYLIWLFYPGGVLAFFMDWFSPQGIGHAWGYSIMFLVNALVWTIPFWLILLFLKWLLRAWSRSF